ncbi:MAG: argininosuccinate lyase, partial [Treponema sp.]|nr:argininosuccinate lyase [Treponema sp.]
ENLERSVEGGFANATDLAEYLVRKGMPFRTAHSVAASAVRRAIDRGLGKIEDLPLDILRECSPLIEADIFGKISPRACMEARRTTGGPSPDRVGEQLETLAQFCRKSRKEA